MGSEVWELEVGSWKSGVRSQETGDGRLWRGVWSFPYVPKCNGGLTDKRALRGIEPGSGSRKLGVGSMKSEVRRPETGDGRLRYEVGRKR